MLLETYSQQCKISFQSVVSHQAEATKPVNPIIDTDYNPNQVVSPNIANILKLEKHLRVTYVLIKDLSALPLAPQVRKYLPLLIMKVISN